MAKLTRYRAKRDFRATGEPRGSEAGSVDERLFVIHKHDATRLHYDLRLQIGDVLKSWAIPKGPSVDPSERRLAVEVEEHPLEYGRFEGIIPEGQYGAGATIIWDRGTWAPSGNIDNALKKGTLKFRLYGEKLRGGWTLARLKPKRDDDKNNWLLIKEHDEGANIEDDILVTQPGSVLSGLTVEDLMAKSTATVVLRPSALKGAKKAELPAKFPPQLASPVPSPPEGANWIHEIKYDGYRTIAVIQNGVTRLFTRKGQDWTKRYGEIAQAFDKLKVRSAAIDGEMVVLDECGASSFEALQQALANGETWRLVFFAFDLVHLNGWNLTDVPLLKRKETLKKALHGANQAIQYSDHIQGQGTDFYDRICEMGLEGVVSKRSDSIYFTGRSKVWLKAKSVQIANFTIIGFKTSRSAEGLSSILVAEQADGEWAYSGKVGTGWSHALADSLLERLQGMTREEPLVSLPKREPGVVWVEPLLKASIQYREKTRDSVLRHPVFRNLVETSYSGSKKAAKRLITDEHLASIWVTNPKRRMFSKTGPTKLDLAVYYAKVGDYMLPHLIQRPVSLIRCPTGKTEDCFFQRHAFTGMPTEVNTFESPGSDKRDYLYIDDARGYLALAQFGVVEFHPWGCKTDKPDRPDRLCFDLDPGEGVAWKDLVDAALAIRDELLSRGLTPFVKTSGSKGLHVMLAISRRPSWKQVHSAANEIASLMVQRHPTTFTLSMSKRQRQNRILIDIHRNTLSSTVVAPYSLRAKTGLPVSTPLSWNDLTQLDGPADLNYVTVPELLRISGDNWADLDATACSLGKVRGRGK